MTSPRRVDYRFSQFYKKDKKYHLMKLRYISKERMFANSIDQNEMPRIVTTPLDIK